MRKLNHSDLADTEVHEPLYCQLAGILRKASLPAAGRASLLSCFLITVGIIFHCLAPAPANAEPIELLKNRGFEEVTNGAPTNWAPVNAGELRSVEDQRSGKAAARFTTRESNAGYCFFASAAIPVKPGAVYHASIWARGSGQFGFLFPQYSTTFLSSIFGTAGEGQAEYRLVPEWRCYEFACKITDPRVQTITFCVRLFGKDTTACFDDASFTFDPAENPGISMADQKIPETTLRFEVGARNASVKIYVDGQELGKETKPSVSINEGLHCIGVSAAAAGDNPGVWVRIPAHPETDNRWRVGLKPETNWLETKFNDQAWPVVTPGPDGFVWTTNAAATNVFFRQIILWNSSHNGPNACLNPPIREWGFSTDSVEPLFLALYSPLPCRLDDYEFILDVPKCFRLLEKVNYKTRYVYNQACQKVEVEDVRHEGQVYTRYRMFYAAREVAPNQVWSSILPVYLSEYAPEYASLAGQAEAWWYKLWRKTDKNSNRFYYRRMARGNFTELEQTLPVRILPPINGRLPRNVMISQYGSVPWCVSRLAPDHLKMHIRQSLRAGFNYWIMGWYPGWGQDWLEYCKFVHDSVISGGGQIVFCPTGQFPLYGSRCKGHVADTLFDWVKTTPGARCRYFQDTPAWNTSEHGSDMYCPSFVTSEGAERFREIIFEAYKKQLAPDGLPGASIIWTDWESHPWVADNGKGSWCFCDRCKQDFRKFANLPETTELSDETILKDYRVKWEEFRFRLDGKIQGELRQVCRELGKPYMVYSWGGPIPFWPACKGNIDLAFPGTPGNSVADSYYQKNLDNTAVFFRDQVGLNRIMGQRFSFFSFSQGFDVVGGATPKLKVMSDDGYVHPKSWKSQILRVVASFHGGVDLQGSIECVGGMQYYIGEATRIIAEYEPLFWDGERADDLAESDQIKYPNLLVLKKDRERLVLLFNESSQPLKVALRNKELQPGQTAEIYGVSKKAANPAVMTVTVPAEDAAAVYIH